MAPGKAIGITINMKANNINGTIKVFGELPWRWKNHLNFRKASIEVQEQEGFYEVVRPVIDFDIEKLGNIYFDEMKSIFTYPVIQLQLDIEEIRTSILTELKSAVRDLYIAVQAYVIEKQIHDETIPSAIKDKIKSIRTKYNQIKAEINALTTVLELVKYKLPYAAIENLKKQLDGIE